MSKRKQGLGLFGLLAVTAMGMMAFASMAQAATPRFFVGGALATAGTVIEGKQESRGTLLVGGLNIEINCEKGTVKEGLIASSVLAEAAVLFEECTVLSISKLPEELPCHVSDVHTGNTALLHVTVLKKSVKPIEFHPLGESKNQDFGLLFEGISVFVNFLSGTGCPLPLKTEVKGAVCALIDNNHTSVEPTLLFSQGVQELEGCKDKLLYGVNEAFIDGSAKVWVKGKGSNLGVLLD